MRQQRKQPKRRKKNKILPQKKPNRERNQLRNGD